MNKQLSKKISELPLTPGVYLYKNVSDEIIYVGKAARLRARVRQYYQKSRIPDAKTDALVAEVVDINWIELESEVDALFLEAELIRRYRPRFNILMRDDKSLIYVRINSRDKYPTVTTLRRPLDDGAEYFGPYINGYAVKKALRYLRKAFPYATSRNNANGRASLHYHLGLDPGLEEGRTSLADYRANLNRLKTYLKGEKSVLIKSLKKEMNEASKLQNYEEAAKLRNQLYYLEQLGRQVLFGDKENLDLSLDEALNSLTSLLSLDKPPKRIEAFDVSHQHGTDRTASMVVFKNGIPDKASYRKFKLRPNHNDDYAGLGEALTRRLSHKNVKKWELPGLILIDGGKGQLTASIEAISSTGVTIPAVIGLAKRFETIIIEKSQSAQALSEKQLNQEISRLGGRLTNSSNFIEVILPEQSPARKLLQRIRDESHRFAVSYHSQLAKSRQSASWLDDIPGIGPVTRKKLIKRFGSVGGIKLATSDELAELLGKKTATRVKSYFKAGPGI